ncbi:hypothetical protein ACPOL_6979 (plasmid) [Acidisarcina polymorpha]|uniref:Uncharacterized protein n=1 Tax=Acidisarcina polymorpha TaxID=2211140 RepID=A0A2Z5GAF3_9BACT|nr:hypothetical protein ACPOL_6979 [Acidisarcina polymorpha]
MAQVACEFAVNANQVFAWRRAYQQGLLEDRGNSGVKLLPAQIANDAVDEASPKIEASPLQVPFTWSFPATHC